MLFLNGIKKLLFIGSSCIYPKYSNQPMKEEELLSGKLKLINEAYAIAKIVGLKCAIVAPVNMGKVMTSILDV